ncbi:kinase-like domain-containing protein [Polychytrium aggregatum]|uniref:kinase-like domain-containing protein n=1 Tax=Polychytrium aggregatum TaxID=110093 RepID=UPI0022FEE372|nr:kinase-like domain-containing protein [Polychytrium aggregatum]KAI9197478.1 kinase-like domain-containing protein [Polychytrium aggregatum]
MSTRHRKSFSSGSQNKSSISGLFRNKTQDEPVHFSSSIADYELLGDIGGIDDISYLYLARFNPTQELVALKYTDLTLSPDFEFVEELIKTIRNASLCRHPNILPYYRSFVENERLWTVTLPIKAGSCRGIMKSYYPSGFSEPVVATILLEVLRAIQYLHANYMIHNDVRADNILLDLTGEVRLSGFRQLATLSRNGEYQQSVFSLVGDNIEWAAPEVMAQNSNYDEKADIYSLGITALELAFNQTPFDDWPPMKVLLSKLEYPCPGIATDKIMSKAFFQMVAACLHKDPAKRSSAQELAAHAFFKNARNAHYLETHLVKTCDLAVKHGVALGQKCLSAPNNNFKTESSHKGSPLRDVDDESQMVPRGRGSSLGGGNRVVPV